VDGSAYTKNSRNRRASTLEEQAEEEDKKAEEQQREALKTRLFRGKQMLREMY
jgi:hypothetical protein